MKKFFLKNELTKNHYIKTIYNLRNKFMEKKRIKIIQKNN